MPSKSASHLTLGHNHTQTNKQHVNVTVNLEGRTKRRRISRKKSIKSETMRVKNIVGNNPGTPQIEYHTVIPVAPFAPYNPGGGAAPTIQAPLTTTALQHHQYGHQPQMVVNVTNAANQRRNFQNQINSEHGMLQQFLHPSQHTSLNTVASQLSQSIGTGTHVPSELESEPNTPPAQHAAAPPPPHADEAGPSDPLAAQHAAAASTPLSTVKKQAYGIDIDDLEKEFGILHNPGPLGGQPSKSAIKHLNDKITKLANEIARKVGRPPMKMSKNIFDRMRNLLN